MEPLLFMPIILSFFVTLIVLPYWIIKAKKVGFVWKDMNKYEKPKIAGSGGLIVMMGFVLGVMSYVAIKTFIFKTNVITIEIFALLTTILISAIIALADDILGWTHGGLSARMRIGLVFLAAVPLIIINAGYTKVTFPFFGTFNLGLLYPIVLIPLGIIGTSTTFNFLAGYNGLEAGQGILIIGALSIVAFLTGASWLTLVGACMVVSLFAFLIFNKYPTKVFPGDVLTYPVGALIAVMAILGNFERIAIFFFIPYIFETLLKIRGKLKKQSFGSPQKDNSLELPYEKFYGLEHIAIWFLKKIKKDKKAYEKEVVYVIYAAQIIIIALGFIIFKKSLF